MASGATVKETRPGGRRKLKNIAFWLTTLMGPGSFVIGGFLNLTRAEQPLVNLHHLGYPIYFATILGFWNLLGAIAIVIPGFPLLKEWAYAGFFFLLTGAAVSHAFTGDPFIGNSAFQVAPPLFFLALVIASWALRPPSRRPGAVRI